MGFQSVRLKKKTKWQIGAGNMKVGVLALQGAYKEHVQVLESLDIKTELIKSKEALEDIDALIIPGGESTAMGKLLESFNMKEALTEKIKIGLPVWGTCAGMILLARDIGGEKTYLNAIDIKVKRNAYGRQLGSFETQGVFNGKSIPMPFIRAPYIEKVGDGVTVLSKVDENMVAARWKNVLVTSFHPEITHDKTVVNYFLNEVVKQNRGC